MGCSTTYWKDPDGIKHKTGRYVRGCIYDEQVISITKIETHLKAYAVKGRVGEETELKYRLQGEEGSERVNLKNKTCKVISQRWIKLCISR
jgi:hypothetical protein